jgi:hypothetical protein
MLEPFLILDKLFIPFVQKFKLILCLATLWLFSSAGAQNVFTLRPVDKPIQNGNTFLYLRDASEKNDAG